MSDRTWRVFVQANARMVLPARVAAYSFARWSRDGDVIAPELMLVEECRELVACEGRIYRENGRPLRFHCDDLCSFMPTRMAGAQRAGYRGRALVIDPDVFALRDPLPLLKCDMQGRAILAKRAPPYRLGPYDSSIMLIDAGRLRHWDFATLVERMFAGDLDYGAWERLALEDPDSVGDLDDAWNSMDSLDEHTRFLHTTNYRTWPWKTGLGVEFWEDRLWVRELLSPSDRLRLLYRGARRRANALGAALGLVRPVGVYPAHPDPRQPQQFFRLLGEAIAAGAITAHDVEREITLGHVRKDLLDRVRECGGAFAASPAPAPSPDHARSASTLRP